MPLNKIVPFDQKVWLSSPTMHGDELKYMSEAYDTNWMSTVGGNINAIEQEICAKVGCGYAVALSAGTSALHLAMKLAGIKPGDEVLCSDMTFSATVNPVIYEGGVPVCLPLYMAPRLSAASSTRIAPWASQIEQISSIFAGVP